uniref:Uncharacterized protein n=1 Tax=Rhizophora mucronata TaxID=61149 RepID=A0A2P2JJ51_RHIMU
MSILCQVCKIESCIFNCLPLAQDWYGSLLNI